MRTMTNTSIQTYMLKTFEHLHSNPEISWEEVKTTGFLKQETEKLGCRVTTFPDSTGLIAEIGNGKPIVAIRADIDALSQEVNGDFQPNHSCGHDAHMTIVLGAIQILKERSAEWEGTIRFIFQPAEEKGTGALKMVELGAVDDVDFLFGVHLRPENEMGDGYAAPFLIHGAARFISASISGEDMHGARPHLGANAIEAGAALVHMLKNIYVNPLTPASIKMTKFISGGESSNIIPGNAEFSLDLRAQTNEAMDHLQNKLEKAFKAVESFYDVKVSFSIPATLPAAIKNDEAVSIMNNAIINSLSEERCLPPIITTGGDDFHFYTIKRPHLKATMLGLGCGLVPGLHHPDMTFRREAMVKGAEILTEAAILALGTGRVDS
ncbi:M20 peptidase aminoacylase family protein [Bacillus canaveralius]